MKKVWVLFRSQLQEPGNLDLKCLTEGQIAVYGAGPIQYLGLHGWGADHRTFEPLAPFVPSEIQLICPNFPGCGGVPPPGEWTIDCVTDQTARILNDHSLSEPLVIIGSCLGAVFGLEMLRRGDISAKRLVIIDPVIFFPMYLRVFLLGKLGEGAYRATLDTRVGRVLANLISRANRSSNIDMTASFEDVDHDSAYRYLKLMTDLPNSERYSDLDLEVDIIYGEETFRTARKSSKALKAIWKHAREHQVPNASHLPIFEQPEQMARLLFARETENKRRRSMPSVDYLERNDVDSAQSIPTI